MKIACRITWKFALAVPALALITACGAHVTTMSGDAPPAGAPGSAPADAGSAVGDSAVSSLTKDTPQNRSESFTADNAPAAPAAKRDLATRSVISTGKIDLHSDDIDKARFELRKLLDTWGGSISNEESTADDQGLIRRARLELRVPARSFDTAMDALPRLGSLVSRARTSTDVSTKVIDTNTRVRSQKLTLARIQALLAQAQSVDQVISVERQLSARQADLDSLEQQQKFLADQTAESTITLYLSRPDGSGSTPEKKDRKTFFSGLSSGWDHLGKGTTAVLNAVGVLLPFGVLALLVAIPARIVWRRRRTGATA